MPCSDRDKIIYNIKELPEVFNVEPVDLFIIENLAGTSIVSFDNIIFDLTQTTFEASFNKHTSDIIELSASVEALEDIFGSTTGGLAGAVVDLQSDVADLNDRGVDWDSVYSTVTANSAAWAPTGSSVEYVTSTHGSGGGSDRTLEVANPRAGIIPYAVSCFIQKGNAGAYTDIGYTKRASGTDGGLAYGGTSFTASTLTGHLKGTTTSINARWVVNYGPEE